MTTKTLKTLTLLGLSACLFTGCDNLPDENASPKVARKPKPVVRPKVDKAEVKKKVEAAPVFGTPGFLDANQGFRDAKFGMTPGDLGNLNIVRRSTREETETYVRPGDVKNLEGVPLDNIEYTFFRGQLVKVELTWKVEYPGSVSAAPLSTDMAGRCSAAYGKPRKQLRTKGGAQYLWSGKNIEILINEFFMPGLQTPVSKSTLGRSLDSGVRTWEIPPATTGQMVLRSIKFKQEMDALIAQKANETHNGL